MRGCCSSPAVMAAVVQVWSLCVFLCGVSHSFPQWSRSPQYPHAALHQHLLPPQSFSQRVAPHQWHGRFPQTLLAPQSSSQRFAQTLLAPQSSSQRFAQTLLAPQSSSQRFAQTLLAPQSSSQRFAQTLLAPQSSSQRFAQTLLAPQSSSQRFPQTLLAPQSSSQRFAQTLLAPQSSSQRFPQAVSQSSSQRFPQTLLAPQSSSQRFPQAVSQSSSQRFPQTLLAPQSSSQRFPQAVSQSSSQRFPQAVSQSSSQRFAQASPALQDKCAVPGDQQVSCGPPAISGADCAAIHCCFDGQRCFYGNAVTVQCVRDGQFVVVVATDLTDPPLSLDALHLLGNDSRCGPVASTPYFGIFQFPVTACGTTVSEDSGYVVYENRLISSYEVGIGPLGSITRDSHFELVVQCRYSDSAVEALVLEVDTVPPPPPVAALGPMRVELRLASGQCVTKGCAAGAEVYSSYYNDTDYPLTKVLREPVYVEVHILARTDPSIVLMLDHCWATSTPSPLGLPRWDLLVNGCPYQGDHYLTLLVPVDGSSALQFPSHYKRFIVKMFTFVDSASLAPLKETIFIHCSTSVCHPSPGDSCSQSCARKRRAVQTDAAPSGQTLVSSGAVTFLL